MTETEGSIARADLRRKVREMQRFLTAEMEIRLEEMMKQKNGIVEHHHANNRSYATAKDFMVAFGRVTQAVCGKEYEALLDDEARKRIDEYQKALLG